MSHLCFNVLLSECHTHSGLSTLTYRLPCAHCLANFKSASQYSLYETKFDDHLLLVFWSSLHFIPSPYLYSFHSNCWSFSLETWLWWDRLSTSMSANPYTCPIFHTIFSPRFCSFSLVQSPQELGLHILATISPGYPPCNLHPFQ